MAIWQRSDPLSRLHSFDFSEMLSWILLSLQQVVSHKLLFFEQQACNTRAHQHSPKLQQSPEFSMHDQAETEYTPQSSFTMSPRNTTLPLHFWYWGSNSEFLRWQRSINDAKWTFLPLFLASLIASFLYLTFSAAMPEFSRIFPIIFPLMPLHLEISMLEASEWICEKDCNES